MKNVEAMIKDLLERELISVKESNAYPGLFVAKYKNKVFYDNLWTKDLQEMRGLVFDRDYNVVAYPFTKIFNRHENGVDIHSNEIVCSVQKINGFMAAATMTKTHGLVVSTTGSLDSDFAVLAKKHLEPCKLFIPGLTYIYEICDPSDPHIIKEHPGVYLIGARNLYDNKMVSEADLDYIASMQSTSLGNIQRPVWEYCRFSEVVEKVKTCQHEGFVVHGQNVSLKIKSPYYLTKKLFARIRAEKMTSQWLLGCKQTIDEEYFDLIDYLQTIREDFVSMQEQDRLTVIEKFLSGSRDLLKVNV